MTRPFVLDTGPLSMVTHPKANERNKKATEWLMSVAQSGRKVMIAEIADYELRRELIRAGKVKSIERLDALQCTLQYLAINTEAVLQAAQFWADARNRGKPTADNKELDGDAILAAQVEQAKGIVVTDNVGHLNQFVETQSWSEIESYR